MKLKDIARIGESWPWSWKAIWVLSSLALGWNIGTFVDRSVGLRYPFWLYPCVPTACLVVQFFLMAYEFGRIRGVTQGMDAVRRIYTSDVFELAGQVFLVRDRKR